MVFGPVEDFNQASGYQMSETAVLVKAMIMGLVGVGVSWMMVCGVRNWMRQQSDSLSTFFVLARAAVLVVAVGAILTIF